MPGNLSASRRNDEKHATKTLMHRRNEAPHHGSKRKLRMTARSRFCFLSGVWEEVDRRCSGIAFAGRCTRPLFCALPAARQSCTSWSASYLADFSAIACRNFHMPPYYILSHMCAVRCDMLVRTVQLKCSRAFRLKDTVRTKSQDMCRQKFRTFRHIGTPFHVP